MNATCAGPTAQQNAKTDISKLSGLANISILDDHNQYLNLLKNLTYIIGSYTIKSLSPWTVETFMTYILHYAFLVALCGVP